MSNFGCFIVNWVLSALKEDISNKRRLIYKKLMDEHLAECKVCQSKDKDAKQS